MNFLWCAEDTDVFDKLGIMIHERAPTLAAQTHFVFVPGPKDALGDGLLPRPPLLGPMTQGLRSRLGHTHFPTNPCRIRYCGQEMVIHRSNVLNDLRQASSIPSLRREGGQEGMYHAARTLYAQSHLTPMIQPLRPVVWCKDHMLRLCPLPDVLVLADQEDMWVDEEKAGGPQAMNPGPFEAPQWNFLVWNPGERKVEKR